MSKQPFFKALALIVACIGCAAAQAQTLRTSARPPAGAGAAGAEAIVARIKDLSKPDRTLKPLPLVETNPRQPKLRRTKDREWAVLDVTYETAPEWLEEVQITYSVLTETPKPANPAQAALAPKEKFSFYTTQETYTDVVKGEHYAGVVLSPILVERYGKPLLFGVEISVNGKSQGMKTEGKVTGIDTAKDWWRSDAMRQDFVAPRDGLKDRSRTLWAVINADDYETVK